MIEQSTATIDIEIAPVEDETDDLDTIGIANEILADIRQTLVARAEYRVTDIATTSQRSGNVLEVLLAVAQQTYEYREVLAPLFGCLVTGLTTLGSWRQVKRIEISRNHDTLVIEGIDHAIAERMVMEFDSRTARFTGKTRIKAKISKRTPRA